MIKFQQRRMLNRAQTAGWPLSLRRSPEYANSLNSLWMPLSDNWFQQSPSRNSSLADSYMPIFMRNNPSNQMPAVQMRACGICWDFNSSFRFRVAVSGSTRLPPWRPFTAGGHQPATLFVVFQMTSAPSGDAALYGFSSGTTGGIIEFYIRLTSGLLAQGVYRGTADGGDNAVSTTALSVGPTYCAVFTTRGLSDREICVACLDRGEDLRSATTATLRSAATKDPDNEQIGFQTQNGDMRFFTTGAIFGCGYINQSLTAAEMANFAIDPWALLFAQTPIRRAWPEVAPLSIRRPRGGLISGSLVLR